MKRLILLVVLCFHVFVLLAQQDVTTFLGIPVDGTKSEMIEKLKEKGFVYSANSDFLKGEFNGEEVEIGVVTNNNKVWRIAVLDKNVRDEQQIKIRYNELCRQFSNNKRYTSSLLNKDSSYVIPYDEDVSYQMSVEEKTYEASFIQNPDTATFFNNPIMQKECPTIYKMVLEIGVSNFENDKVINEYLKSVPKEEAMNYVLETFRMVSFLSKKSVWFKISGSYDRYYIVMYYDNQYNKANGEDL
jgi:hypothetical protein